MHAAANHLEQLATDSVTRAPLLDVSRHLVCIDIVVQCVAFAVWSAQLVMSGALHPQDLQWALGLPGLVCSGKPRIYIRFLVSKHWIESMVLFSLNTRYFVLLHFRPDLRFPIVWQRSGKPWRKNIWRNTKPSEESTTYTKLPLIFGPMLASHGTKHWQQWLKLLTRQLMNASDETSLRPVRGFDFNCSERFCLIDVFHFITWKRRIEIVFFWHSNPQADNAAGQSRAQQIC